MILFVPLFFFCAIFAGFLLGETLLLLEKDGRLFFLANPLYSTQNRPEGGRLCFFFGRETLLILGELFASFFPSPVVQPC